jgi:hypothetical protein
VGVQLFDNLLTIIFGWIRRVGKTAAARMIPNSSFTATGWLYARAAVNNPNNIAYFAPFL